MSNGEKSHLVFTFSVLSDTLCSFSLEEETKKSSLVLFYHCLFIFILVYLISIYEYR